MPKNEKEPVVTAEAEKNEALADSMPVDPGELNICIGCE